MSETTPGQAPKPAERIACEAFWAAVGAGPDGCPLDAAWAWAKSMGTEHAWRAVVAPELALREGIRQLLADITASADATRPSKKTALEDEFAIALRKLLEGK